MKNGIITFPFLSYHMDTSSVGISAKAGLSSNRNGPIGLSEVPIACIKRGLLDFYIVTFNNQIILYYLLPGILQD